MQPLDRSVSYRNVVIQQQTKPDSLYYNDTIITVHSCLYVYHTGNIYCAGKEPSAGKLLLTAFWYSQGTICEN